MIIIATARGVYWASAAIYLNLAACSGARQAPYKTTITGSMCAGRFVEWLCGVVIWRDQPGSIAKMGYYCRSSRMAVTPTSKLQMELTLPVLLRCRAAKARLPCWLKSIWWCGQVRKLLRNQDTQGLELKAIGFSTCSCSKLFSQSRADAD